MQAATLALHHNMAQFIWCGALQARKARQWEADHSPVVQGDHHAPATPIISGGHSEQLALHAPGGAPGDRLELFFRGDFKLSHESFSIRRRLLRRVPGCGRSPLLKQHDDFVCHPDALVEGHAVRLYVPS